MKKYKIAVLDDYQSVALESADWFGGPRSSGHRRISGPPRRFGRLDQAVACLLMSFVSCASGPRCTATSLSRPSQSQLIASTGPGNASIDIEAAGDHGIAVVHTGYSSDPAIEFTWALILASRATES